jgi:hypothetical protein
MTQKMSALAIFAPSGTLCQPNGWVRLGFSSYLGGSRIDFYATECHVSVEASVTSAGLPHSTLNRGGS